MLEHNWICLHSMWVHIESILLRFLSQCSNSSMSARVLIAGRSGGLPFDSNPCTTYWEGTIIALTVGLVETVIIIEYPVVRVQVVNPLKEWEEGNMEEEPLFRVRFLRRMEREREGQGRGYTV